MKFAIIGQGYVGEAFNRLVHGKFDYITYDPKTNKKYPSKDIASADIAVVCVPTNPKEDGSCDISIVEQTVAKLSNKHILIKSTVKPGTTEYLSKKYKKNICFSPEYIGESTYNNSYYNEMIDTPFLIVGGDPTEAYYYFEIFEKLWGPECVYYQCSSLEAEIIKYMENSFFATKVTFVNEFYEITKTYGADWYKIREGWLLDKRINRSFTSVFYDKRGFSGKCLPKDIKAIFEASQEKGYSSSLLKTVIETNERIIDKNKENTRERE